MNKKYLRTELTSRLRPDNQSGGEEGSSWAPSMLIFAAVDLMCHWSQCDQAWPCTRSKPNFICFASPQHCHLLKTNGQHLFFVFFCFFDMSLPHYCALYYKESAQHTVIFVSINSKSYFPPLLRISKAPLTQQPLSKCWNKLNFFTRVLILVEKGKHTHTHTNLNSIY